MPYRQRWESSRPGCLIFLLDQSGSMADPFGETQAGARKRKCDMVATVLNGFLNELIVTNTVIQKDGENTVKPRAEIALLGYNGNHVGSLLSGVLTGMDFVSLPDLQMSPLAIERRMKQEMNDIGEVIEMSVQFPIWVQPVAGGGTPMCAALEYAYNLVENWTYEHPDHYPPVVINVTDGAATDGDPSPIVQRLCQLGTSDGNTLLFNIHITALNSHPVFYPAGEDELPPDRYARLLFSLSSIIPEPSREPLQQMLGREIFPTTRGFIFNGDAASVRHMFVFATVPATKPLDLDR